MTPIYEPIRDFVIGISGHADGLRRSTESLGSFAPEPRGVLSEGFGTLPLLIGSLQIGPA